MQFESDNVVASTSDFSELMATQKVAKKSPTYKAQVLSKRLKFFLIKSSAINYVSTKKKTAKILQWQLINQLVMRHFYITAQNFVFVINLFIYETLHP